jgi:hypothetical protein
VAELTRAMIVNATREKRFVPWAVRIDSAVIQADVKHPTDAGLASVDLGLSSSQAKVAAGQFVGDKLPAPVLKALRAEGISRSGFGSAVSKTYGKVLAKALNLIAVLRASTTSQAAPAALPVRL